MKILYLSTLDTLRGNPLEWKFIYGVQPQHYKLHVLYSYTRDDTTDRLRLIHVDEVEITDYSRSTLLRVLRVRFSCLVF